MSISQADISSRDVSREIRNLISEIPTRAAFYRVVFYIFLFEVAIAAAILVLGLSLQPNF
jgi:hypothetical protein